MKKYILFIVVAFVGCKHNTQKLPVIDLKAYLRYNLVIMDSVPRHYFSNYRALFLEHTDENKPEDIRVIKCMNQDTIAILLDNHLKFYNAVTGNFIQDLNNPETESEYSSFDVNPETRKILALNNTQKGVSVFSSSGAYENSILLEHEYEYQDLKILDNEHVLLTVKQIPSYAVVIVNLMNGKTNIYGSRNAPKNNHKAISAVSELKHPLYITYRLDDQVLLKYLFNDTLFSFTSTGKSSLWFVQNGKEAIALTRKLSVKNNNMQYLKDFWEMDNGWVIRIHDHSYQRMILCDSLFNSKQEGVFICCSTQQPFSYFEVTGRSRMLLDESNKVLFGMYSPKSKEWKNYKLPEYLENSSNKNCLLITYYKL